MLLSDRPEITSIDLVNYHKYKKKKLSLVRLQHHFFAGRKNDLIPYTSFHLKKDVKYG